MKRAEELRRISESYKGPGLSLIDRIHYYYIIIRAAYTAKTTGKDTIYISRMLYSDELAQKLTDDGFDIECHYFSGAKYFKSISW